MYESDPPHDPYGAPRRDPADDEGPQWPREGVPLVAPGEPPRDFKKMLLGGLGVAVAAGLVFGLLARPHFTDNPSPNRAERVAENAPQQGINIEVKRRYFTPPPVVPVSSGKLETMSSPPLVDASNPSGVRSARPTLVEMTASAIGRMFGGSSSSKVTTPSEPAPRQAQVQPRVERIDRVQPDEPQPELQQADYPDDPPMEAPMARPQPRIAPPPPRATFQPTARPSFNCQYARTRAERMVCTDPDLAAADRRLARAFRNAVDNGVPERALRAQQDRWLRAREQAAIDPEAVAMVYEARIHELEDMGY